MPFRLVKMGKAIDCIDFYSIEIQFVDFQLLDRNRVLPGSVQIVRTARMIEKDGKNKNFLYKKKRIFFQDPKIGTQNQ